MESQIRSRVIRAGLPLICFSLFFSSVTAQSLKSIDLEEAIRLSLQNSKGLKIAAAKVMQAEAGLSEAKLRQYPDVKVSGAYLRVNQPTIDVKVPLGREEGTGGAGAQEIKVDQAVYGMATATLPIFSGLRIRNGIESARYLKKAAELDASRDKEELIQNTVAAYYNLYKAQAAVHLVNENLKQAKQRVADFSNMEANGLLARNDLLKAQLQESNVELALTDAVNNRNIANFNMDLMLGLDEQTELGLDTSGISRLPAANSLEDWETTAVASRSDYGALQQRELAGVSDLKATKGEYYPSVALTGGYVAADVPGLLTVTNAVNVGIGLNYNLAALYKNGAKVKQARARQEQMHWALAQLDDQIRMQVHQAYQNYVENLKKIEVHTKALEQAKENYRITKNKYDNALATTTDLLDADVAYLQAGINFEYAKADALVAYNKLKETTGVIREKEQVR